LSETKRKARELGNGKREKEGKKERKERIEREGVMKIECVLHSRPK